jgi:hypothetical protein
MAASSYSSYNRPSRVALKKKAPAARLIRPTPAPKLSFNTVGKPTAGAGLLKKAVAPRAAPAGPVLPAAPSIQAVPTITPPAMGPPPQSLQSASDRIDITQQYGQGMNDINRGIYDAALAYGGENKVQQFGYDPTGSDTSSALDVAHSAADNSALSVINRNLAATNKNIDETAGAQNTFFSSNRLADLQTQNSEADRQRIAAKKQYDDAIATYISNLTGLRSSRDSGLRNADISDIAAATANAPIPEQASSVPEAAAEAAPANPFADTAAQQAVGNIGGPKAGFQFVQASGPNAGLSYNLVMHNGAYWRRYEDGRLVPR